MPKIGERVRCRPAAGEAVQRGPGLHEQFLPAEGAEVTWSPYHQQRLQDGSITLDASYYHAERLQNRLRLLDGEIAACQGEEQQKQRDELTAQWKQLKGEYEALTAPKKKE